jgi:hypothetical protein
VSDIKTTLTSPTDIPFDQDHLPLIINRARDLDVSLGSLHGFGSGSVGQLHRDGVERAHHRACAGCGEDPRAAEVSGTKHWTLALECDGTAPLTAFGVLASDKIKSSCRACLAAKARTAEREKRSEYMGTYQQATRPGA